MRTDAINWFASSELSRSLQDGGKTPLTMNAPVLIVDQHFTNELLKLPLRERAERLRQQGHQIERD
jgi:hypothetical protein